MHVHAHAHSQTHTLLIDFHTDTVTTITGTGYQGKEGRARRTDQEISSPWDIAVGTAPGM